MTEAEISNIIDEVFGLYENFGSNDYIGEEVSQLEHMCQAARMAEREGYDQEVILAAFFHDIGHLCAPAGESMGGYGSVRHERLGADYLRRVGFSEKIARLVESHVEAKRYLTKRYPVYYEKLSPASRTTLHYQGGPMTDAELALFESHPEFDLFIKLRQWDEAAKIKGLPLPELTHYRQMARQHLRFRWMSGFLSE